MNYSLLNFEPFFLATKKHKNSNQQQPILSFLCFFVAKNSVHCRGAGAGADFFE